MKRRLGFIACAYLMLFVAASARADTLDEIRQRGSIRWGGDQEGGGPYIYPKPDNPREITGFEVELMDLLAARLGVKSEFQQCQWTTLPDLLRIKNIDIIVNGYELTEGHLTTKIATVPYYIYQYQLIARRDDPSITSWDDLKKSSSGNKKEIGVLGPTAMEFVRQRLGPPVEIIQYETSTDAMEEVKNRKLDATIQDMPPAVFYRNRFPQLHFVGPPEGKGYYVIYLRPGDERLRDELNLGLIDLIESGQLRSLYERYGLWSSTQDELAKLAKSNAAVPLAIGTQESTTTHGWKVIRKNLPLLLESAGMTVVLTILSMPLAIMMGLLIALGRLYGPWPLQWVLSWHVEILRGTPVMLQLYTIFFLLPIVGIRLPAFLAAVIGLAVNYSAYEAEIYRAGLLAIPVGQMEAALSLGMTKWTALRRVIVPQAVRLVVPPVTNDFIALFKDTSICSVITVVELTKSYSILANSTGAYLEFFAVTALLYMMMSYPLSLLARRLERRTKHVAM
jgi:polar amino acid transport system substrate-binding protein